MAAILQQLFCLALLLFACPADSSSDEIPVYQFPPDKVLNNYLIIQPKNTALQTSGYAICLRAMFWTWGYRVLIDTENILLGLYNYYPQFGFFKNGQNSFDFPWENANVSPSIWNTFCISFNQSESTISITINGQPVHNSYSTVGYAPNQITIGGKSALDGRFSGQITDFNFWNKPLALTEIEEFSSGCNTTSFLEKLKPEFVLWSEVNITFRAKSTNNYTMKRETLCSLLSNNFAPDSLLLFGYRPFTYDESISTCEQMNGKIVFQGNINENFLEREEKSLKNLCSNKFWMSAKKLGENKNNSDLIMESPFTENNAQCFYYDVSKAVYNSTSCKTTLCVVCQIPEARLKFQIKPLSKQLYLESDYFLINCNGYAVFAGLNRLTIINSTANAWSAFYYNALNILDYRTEFKNFGNLSGKTRFPIMLQTLVMSGNL
jgi:hypothetical protein